MKKTLSIIAVVFVTLLLLCWLGGTWAIGNAIKSSVEKADAENDSFSVSDYRKGFFSSEAVTDLGSVEESVFSLRQDVAHGPLAIVGGVPKVCASHIVTKLHIDSQPEAVRSVIAKLFGEGVEPFVAETSVNLAGDQSTKLTIASANTKEDDLEVRFDGAEIDWNLASDKSEFDLTGDCPPISLKGKGTDEGKSVEYSIRAEGFDLNAGYEKGGFLKSESRWGKIRASFQSEDEAPVKIDMQEITVNADMKAKSDTFDQVWLGNSTLQVSGVNISAAMGEAMPVGEYGIDKLTFSSNIVDNKNGTINMEGGYELSGIKGGGGDDNPMAGLFSYLAPGAKVSFTLNDAPYEFVQQFASSQASQYGDMMTMASAAAKDPAQAQKFQQEMNAKNVDTLFNSLQLLKDGMNMDYQIQLAPGKDQTEIGLSLKYTNKDSFTSLKTVGELLKALELNIDGKVSSAAIEAFPMLGMILQPQVEAGMLIADPSTNQLTISASLKDAQLTVNNQPSPMQMMVEMFSAQELDWDAIKAGMTNPAEAGQEE